MGMNFFEIGKQYRSRRGRYEVIAKDKKKIRIRTSDGQEKWEDDLEFLEKLHREIVDEENAIRLVCHHKKCWDRDQRIIGFHKKQQWDILKINSIIIYFRISENQIKGVFKIVEKDINLNPDFSSIPGISEALTYQCRLELISDDIICDDPMGEDTFSFFDQWAKEKWGGRQTQVFKAERKDLELILQDPSVVIFEY